MCKILIIAGIVVFFFVLLALAILKLFPGKDPTGSEIYSTQSPFDATLAKQNIDLEASAEIVVKECYQWYLRYYPSVTSSEYNDLAANPTVQRCFTADLIESWKEFMEVAETDPILISNGYYDSWQKDVRTRLVSQVSQSSTVELLLGTASEMHTLSVSLRRGSGAWQIQSILYTPLEEERSL